MRVLVGGLLRNGAASLTGIEGFVVALRERIPQLEVFVFENNSDDGTPAGLAEIAARLPWFHVRSEVWDMDAFRDASLARTADNRPCRIELIAEARNRLLDWMRDGGLAAADRLVMIDWDFASAPPLDPLARTLQELPEDLDGVFANGTGAAGRYYDLYELRTEDYPLGPELLGDRFWNSRRRNRALARVIGEGEPRVPVFSAFGGLAVYRPDAVGDCRYSAVPTPQLHAFNLEVLRDLADRRQVRERLRSEPETHHKGALLGVELFGDGLFYTSNSGYAFPIAAEHVNLHVAMRARGRGRFAIEPALRYLSTH